MKKTHMENIRKSTRVFRVVWMTLVLIFLYAPILVMIALSFNASVSRSQIGRAHV